MIGFLIDFIFCRLAETTVLGSPLITWLPRSDVSLGGQCSCHLRLFSKLCMHVVNKKVNYAALQYCVAANCNNSQTTPGITVHELPRNRPAVRRKWIKFIQIKRADFLAVLHHAHFLRSEHFSECDFAKPMEYWYSFKILPGRPKLIWLYPCGLSGKVSVSSSELELAILQRLPRVT